SSASAASGRRSGIVSPFVFGFGTPISVSDTRSASDGGAQPVSCFESGRLASVPSPKLDERSESVDLRFEPEQRTIADLRPFYGPVPRAEPLSARLALLDRSGRYESRESRLGRLHDRRGDERRLTAVDMPAQGDVGEVETGRRDRLAHDRKA